MVASCFPKEASSWELRRRPFSEWVSVPEAGVRARAAAGVVTVVVVLQPGDFQQLCTGAWGWIVGTQAGGSTALSLLHEKSTPLSVLDTWESDKI